MPMMADDGEDGARDGSRVDVCGLGAAVAPATEPAPHQTNRPLRPPHLASSAPGEWLRVARLSDFAGRQSLLAAGEWTSRRLAPVALFRFGATTDAPVYAIQDECPHVAIGALVSGDATHIDDIENFNGTTCKAAVSCPVHAFTFDLETGLCIAGPTGATPAARTYDVQLRPLPAATAQSDASGCTAAAMEEHVAVHEVQHVGAMPSADSNVFLWSQPRAVPSATATEEQRQDGNRIQLHLVKKALQRKYGNESSASDEDLTS